MFVAKNLRDREPVTVDTNVTVDSTLPNRLLTLKRYVPYAAEALPREEPARSTAQKDANIWRKTGLRQACASKETDPTRK